MFLTTVIIAATPSDHSALIYQLGLVTPLSHLCYYWWYVHEDKHHLSPKGKALRAQSAGEILVACSEGAVLLPNP